MLSLVEKFKNNKIARNDYWLEMLQIHERLIDYQKLLNQNQLVKKIEIDKNSFVVALHNDLKFIWDPKDLRSPVSVAVNNGVYEKEELEFVKLIVKDLKVLFDVGGNIGWFCLHLSKFINSTDSVIYTFEPVKNTFNQLEKNINLNQVKNIKVYNFALGEKEEVVNFYIPMVTGSVAACMTNLLDERCHEESCLIKRLDDFVKKSSISKIDFLKCDVEGAELFVLKGGFESIKNLKPILFVEMLRKWSSKFNYHPNDIIFLLGRIGYSCFYIENKKLVLLTEVSDFTTATNFLFLDKDKHKNIISKYS
jgi:FkbM family methyltransferase